jgi:hypothetical protein
MGLVRLEERDGCGFEVCYGISYEHTMSSYVRSVGRDVVSGKIATLMNRAGDGARHRIGKMLHLDCKRVQLTP